MGSAFERHTAGSEALAFEETARELAARGAVAQTPLRRIERMLGEVPDPGPGPPTAHPKGSMIEPPSCPDDRDRFKCRSRASNVQCP